MSKVWRDTDPEKSRIRKELFNIFLVKMTKEACLELNTSGLGFVLSTMTIWATELQESGMAKPAAKYLRALANLIDPENNLKKRHASEQRRREAFDEMSALADRDGWAVQQDPKDPQP